MSRTDWLAAHRSEVAADWLAAHRSEVAADRILDAAERLYTKHDPASIGMNEIARAAGCSRATLYRYFESREALRTAYVHRETLRLGREIMQQIGDIDDPRDQLITSITATLRMVRQRPALAAWFASTRPPIGGELAGQSEVIAGLAAAFLQSLGPEAPAAVERRARWTVRVIVSLLMFPGQDEADERAMLEEFVAPVVTPFPTRR
ncbi:TetR/AcrR family transcriptional regulator [Mycobacterium pseudoshottsii]|uniref:TetR/AcrR family transcriptional regulator n=1 Tax=Mycobacterium pseudoshottsii TaxID=265949 RepID=UPI00076F07AE|nr:MULTISPECIES: TetR/AcrR family transcriptional regulator [Mycobacterium ulcerans group]MBC9862244.1 Transcriptional regulator, AcrR family [Mycobacterium pseudoshottsii]RFZ65478.1 Bacterial regulatory protein, tetR family [Mycobacterium marinum]BBA87290.1 putative HTH-type transcriptional regulator [Mycobacterium pseudoshottsii JCM 15466]GAQ34150.1 oxidoreductase subunit [Mycobacterium pseudoshottsii JCM 15466]